MKRLRLRARRVHQTDTGERITFIFGDASRFGFVTNVTAGDLAELSERVALSHRTLAGAQVAAELEVHSGQRCRAACMPWELVQ
jgi:hypothetical protein